MQVIASPNALKSRWKLPSTDLDTVTVDPDPHRHLERSEALRWITCVSTSVAQPVRPSISGLLLILPSAVGARMARPTCCSTRPAGDTTDPRHLVRYDTGSDGLIRIDVQPIDLNADYHRTRFLSPYSNGAWPDARSSLASRRSCVDFPLSDTTESYIGDPSNPADVIAFYDAYVDGTDVNPHF